MLMQASDGGVGSGPQGDRDILTTDVRRVGPGVLRRPEGASADPARGSGGGDVSVEYEHSDSREARGDADSRHEGGEDALRRPAPTRPSPVSPRR